MSHIPVMCEEMYCGLNIQPGGTYIDATFGGGGYTRAMLERQPTIQVYATDRDPAAIERGQALKQQYPQRLFLYQASFSQLIEVLADLKARVDGIVFDLGVSSFQLDTPERGFSFRQAGPLDMRMTPVGPTAADIVNTWPEAQLADIIYTYGEEHFARRIARRLVEVRQHTPFTTTQELATVIRQVVRKTQPGIDPATRTFQALRIAVNDELREVSAGLQAAAFLLKPGGRLVVVSFHSLEDRLVKQAINPPKAPVIGPMKYQQKAPTSVGYFRVITRKPQLPTEAETTHNPRARSARLRVAERTETAWGAI